MNITVKQIYRIVPHLAFWVGYFLISTYQNTNESWLAKFEFLGILCFAAIAVYINLYLLLPRFFFTKKYMVYAVLLLTTILTIAFIITFSTYWIFNNQEETGFIQNSINIFFFMLLTSGSKFLRDNNRKQVRINTLENAQLKAELSLLKAQVNPHFLFNSLNNLYGMILQNRNEQASQTILKLSNLMRYVLESSQHEKIALAAEIEFIQDYLQLERIRIAQEFDIHFETSLSHSKLEIPPLLFIPLVENIFKHAVTQHTTKGFAHISLSLQGNQLFFEVKNSLSNHPVAETHKSGTGLANLKKRLEILYSEKYDLSIEKKEQTYQITLLINL